MKGPVKDVCDKYEEWTLSNETVIVTESDPDKNEKNVPVDKKITLTFNEKIKAGSNWIELVSNTGEMVPIKKTIEGNTLTLEPTTSLANGTEYYIVLHSKSITDLDGNELNAYSIFFTTENL